MLSQNINKSSRTRHVGGCRRRVFFKESSPGCVFHLERSSVYAITNIRAIHPENGQGTWFVLRNSSSRSYGAAECGFTRRSCWLPLGWMDPRINICIMWTSRFCRDDTAWYEGGGELWTFLSVLLLPGKSWMRSVLDGDDDDLVAEKRLRSPTLGGGMQPAKCNCRTPSAQYKMMDINIVR